MKFLRASAFTTTCLPSNVQVAAASIEKTALYIVDPFWGILRETLNLAQKEDIMNNQHKYVSKHLNCEIAPDIIKDWFKVRINLTQIVQRVLIHHFTHKGLPPDPNEPCRLRDFDFIVQKALFRLQRDGYVKSVSCEDAMWEISGRPPRVYGKGEKSVYLFYNYREDTSWMTGGHNTLVRQVILKESKAESEITDRIFITISILNAYGY